MKILYFADHSEVGEYDNNTKIFTPNKRFKKIAKKVHMHSYHEFLHLVISLDEIKRVESGELSGARFFQSFSAETNERTICFRRYPKFLKHFKLLIFLLKS